MNLSAWPISDEIVFQGLTFDQIDPDAWKAKYSDQALDTEDFARQFDQVPNQFEDEFTYWEIEYSARDPEYVIEVVERKLEVVLGQIIYSMLPWSHSNRFSHGNVWNRPWSELRPPFVYLIRDGSGYHDYYFDDDISPRRVIRLFKDREDRLEFLYSQIPPLDSPNKIESKLIMAFRNFHSGATEPNRRRAFLDYWRAIETLCLFEKENMNEVVSRIRSVVPYEDSDLLFENRIEEIKEQRNEYVHEQVNVEITDRDNEFLRQMFYELLPFFMINHETDVDKLLIWLDYGDETPEVLDRNIEMKTRELHTIQKVRDSKEK